MTSQVAEGSPSTSSLGTRSLRSSTSHSSPLVSSSLSSRLFPRHSALPTRLALPVSTRIVDDNPSSSLEGSPPPPFADARGIPTEHRSASLPAQIRKPDKGKEREHTPLAAGDSETAERKRVQPARSSRRNVPTLGLGNSPVDLLILNSQQAADANKPVLPPNAVFFLTTDSSLVPPPAAGEQLNYSRAHRFAPRRGEEILTPEFWPLPTVDAVTSRLRTRADEEPFDTSDAAYIARHRRYETMEKRQRTQEKEKLVHERYKLKERLEQLRAIDSGPALSVDTEGRKKLKILLRQGEELERRYDLLLPAESRKRKGEVGEAGTSTPQRPPSNLSFKFKFRVPPKRSHSSVAHSSDMDEGDESDGEGEVGEEWEDAEEASDEMEQEPPANPSQNLTAAAARMTIRSNNHRKTYRDSSGRFTSSNSLSSTNVSPVKRPRISEPADPTASPPIAHRRKVPVILQAAERAIAEPNAKRKTPRHALAFGLKIPDFLDEVRDFELPDWDLLRERSSMYELGDGTFYIAGR